MKGFFITFEGPDGAGKTTQIRLLDDYLKERGYQTLVTREPGGTRIGEKIRSIILDPDYNEMEPVCEMLLYAAARAQHVAQLIKPALNQGKIVLCDRFVDSSIAYQGYGRGLGIETVEAANTFALHGIVPDLTLFFDLHPSEGIRRSSRRRQQRDRLEQEEYDFHINVYKGFKALHDKYPERIVSIDANCDVKEVFRQIADKIEQLLYCRK